jgi:hypothetical protein
MDASAVNRVLELSQQGSPVALHAFGRLFGLGKAERGALFQGDGIPRWAWLGVGLAAGAAVGIYAHRRWPAHAGRLIGG